MVSVSSVAHSTKSKGVRKALDKTFESLKESLNDRVSFTIEPVPEKEKDDPYTETFNEQTMLSGSKHNYYPPYEKHVEDGVPVRIEFEPTASYLHEVVKFKTKHASTRDKVVCHNQVTKFWDAD